MSIYDDALAEGQRVTKEIIDQTISTLEADRSALQQENTSLVESLADAQDAIGSLNREIDRLNGLLRDCQSQPPTGGTSKTLFGACPTNPGGSSYSAAQTVVTKFGQGAAIRQFNSSTLTWNDVPAGSLMHRSYKPATTITDAQIDALLRSAEGHMLTFWHEPDNDGLSATARADRIKLMNRLYERKLAIGVSTLVVPTFTGGFFASYGSQANRDLWTTVKGDLVGIDCDGVHVKDTDSDYTSIRYDDEIENVLVWLEQHRANGFKGFTVPEFGTSRRAFDPDGSKRTAWMKTWSDYFIQKGAHSVIWFDYDNTVGEKITVPSKEYDYWKSRVATNSQSS